MTTETKPSLRILDGEAPLEPPVGLARALGEAEGRSGEHPRGLEIPAVLRALPEGVIVFGTDGCVWATNDAARSFFGREPAPGSAASGVLAALRIAGDEPLHFDRWPVANALTGETVTEVELNVRTQSLDESASVEVPAIASVAPIHWTSGIVGVVLTVRPVPRIRDRERRWEEFVRTVVHESRGALSAILGCVSLVESLAQEPIRPRRTPGYVDPETQFLGMIKSDAWQISAMMSELLDVARISAHDLKLDLQPVDVAALVEDVVEHLAPNTGALATGHHLAITRRRLVRIVEADSARVEQAVVAFVTTLARYSPPGSEISLAIDSTADLIVIAAGCRDSRISSAEVSRLFDEYSRRHDLRQSAKTHVSSLFVARGLIEAHGGRVWAETSDEQGTTFRLSLPVR